MSLYDRRTAGSLTQRELAQKLGVSTRSVSAWETGEHGTSATHRRALAAVLGGSPSDYYVNGYTANLVLTEEARAVLEAWPPLPSPVTEGSYYKHMFDKAYAVLKHYAADPDHPREAELVWLRELVVAAGEYRAQLDGGDPFEKLRARCVALVDRILGQL